MSEDPLLQRIGTKENGENTIENAMEEIQSISDHLGLSDEVTQVAEAIYRRGLRTEIVNNSTIAQLSTAAVYASCRTQNIAYSSKEIAQASLISKSELDSVFTDLVEQTGLKEKIGPVDPEQYISEYCGRLQLSTNVEQKAIEITKESRDRNLLSGKSPSTFAASSVYTASLLCNESRSQHEVSNASKVSVRAIRDRYQEQAEWILDYIEEP